MSIVMKQVDKTYGEGPTAVHALRGIDLEIPSGEFAVLLGPSGSGKTTALNLTGAIDDVTAGSLVVLHLATLLAVLIVFWKEIFSLFGPNAKVILLVAIGTVPAVVVGLAAKVYLEQAFDKLWVAGIGFFITSYFLLSHEKYKETDERIERTLKMMTIGNALLIGLAQALAILPGASRSGLTICTARLLRVDRSAAASFSFLLAIPAIGGAAVIEMEALQDLHLVAEPGAVLAGFIAALVTGLVSLLLLLRMLKWGRFAWFAPYTIVLGIVAIWLSVVGG